MSASGSLFIVGGKDGRNEDRILLDRFLELCGGRRARVLVITTASPEPERPHEEYAAAFSKLGARGVSILHPATRKDADAPALLSALDRAEGVYFSGGGQRRLVATLGGSKFDALLRERHRRGLPVGGTSAGASALSTVMLAGGKGRTALQTGSAELSTGFGLLPGVIVDQHFQQRKRMGRLFAAVTRNPEKLGFGVDEATAAEIDPCRTRLRPRGGHAHHRRRIGARRRQSRRRRATERAVVIRRTPAAQPRAGVALRPQDPHGRGAGAGVIDIAGRI